MQTALDGRQVHVSRDGEQKVERAQGSSQEDQEEEEGPRQAWKQEQQRGIEETWVQACVVELCVDDADACVLADVERFPSARSSRRQVPC
ncbi:hypothetical protein [Ktedonobacter sp. SOSP1-52]|uniref:hypothetical protein n=1 Tax=Ktedonobacter sp. SOSP1-52 TaxID=2778366 RepID=UPI00191681CC|nr:hypothetical protein [Ktedonobacter sp. SOSP1-52]